MLQENRYYILRYEGRLTVGRRYLGQWLGCEPGVDLFDAGPESVEVVQWVDVCFDAPRVERATKEIEHDAPEQSRC